MDSVEIPENKRLLETYLFDKSLAKFSCVTFFYVYVPNPDKLSRSQRSGDPARGVPAKPKSRFSGEMNFDNSYSANYYFIPYMTSSRGPVLMFTGVKG
jgi:hypothetical protein